MNRKTIPIFLSSDPSTGSITTDNGGRMTIRLDPPIQLDANKRLSCALHSINTWYTFPNVSPELNNNHFRFQDGATPYDFTIPKGLYSVEALEETIGEFLVNATPALPANTFKFQPDNATGTISFQINKVGITVFWSDANSVGSLLGFVTDDGPSVTSGLWYESDNQASLNLLTEILVNFSAGGSYFNTKGGSNVIYAFPPSGPVGGLISQEPSNLIETKLIGDHHDLISVWLTNASTGEVLDTAGEVFTCNILLFEDTL